MAGTDPGFDAAEFRSAIAFAMEMGMPGSSQDELVFRWKEQRVFGVRDPAGKPYDWTATPTSDTTITDLRLTCAFEFVSVPSGSVNTIIGGLDTSRLVVTLMDEQYAEMIAHGSDRKPDFVIVGGNTYELDFTAPPVGLFDVTIFQIYASAIDES